MPHLECPTIQLTSAELRQYDDIVGQMLLRTIHEYDLVSSAGVVPQQWTPVKRHKQMIVYRNLQGTPNPRTTLMLGIGTIKGSLEDVMDGLYCDTTEELRGVKTLLKSKFIDGAVMNVSETRSPEDPYRFAGIKWFAAKAPGGITHHRDMLTYERMGTTVDENGDEIAYHILQSINRPEWPANMLRHIKRAHTSNCFLYRRKQGHVECFFLSEFHASGSAAKWFADYAIACKWLSVLRTAECAEAKKLSQLIDHARFSSYSRSNHHPSNHCDTCKARPAMFEHLRICAGCRQNVCKPCSTRKQIFQVDPKTNRPETERFCHSCVALVATRRGSTDQSAMLGLHRTLTHTLTTPMEDDFYQRWNNQRETLTSLASEKVMDEEHNPDVAWVSPWTSILNKQPQMRMPQHILPEDRARPHGYHPSSDGDLSTQEQRQAASQRNPRKERDGNFQDFHAPDSPVVLELPTWNEDMDQQCLADLYA